MFKKILFAALILAVTGTYAFANTANFVPATTYTDNSNKESDDTFTTKIYEGSTVVCSTTTGNSCTFTAPACGTGIHTYFGTTTSSKYTTESTASANVTWTASICSKTPKPPSSVTISTN
jgi:hypothetical protein